MFGIAKIPNSNVWKRKSPEFQCFAEPNFTIPMFRKAQTREFQCLEYPKFKIPLFGNAKI